MSRFRLRFTKRKDDLDDGIQTHPELLMQETRTAEIAADHLRASGFEVTTGYRRIK